MLRSFALTIGVVMAAMAGSLPLAVAQPASYYYSPQPVMAQPTDSYAPQLVMAQPTGYYSPQPVMAQPAGYYSPHPVMAPPTGSYAPQSLMAQPAGYYAPGNGYAPRPMYVASNANGPNYGYAPGTPASHSPTLANPAAAHSAVGGQVSGGPAGAVSSSASGYEEEGWGGMGRCGGAYDMPQHYSYYPPMHGYYYFRPYHYTHVPTQRGFATQFGVDPRNPYSNDFFKVVYAEYKASLLRSSPEHIATPPGASQFPAEPPTEMLKKLRSLKEEGVLSNEEFEMKKAEILGRM